MLKDGFVFKFPPQNMISYSPFLTPAIDTVSLLYWHCVQGPYMKRALNPVEANA